MTDRNIPGIDDHTGREVIRSNSVRPVSKWTPPTIAPFVPPAERGLGLYQKGSATTTPLTETERARLAKHEETIRAGLQTFHEVGTALLDIRDSRLYRETHKTFEAYCLEQWNISKTHANRLIDASEVIANLTPIGVTLPENEAQARELAKLSDIDQVLVWKTVAEAAEKTGGKATAGLLKDMAETLEEIRDTGHLTINDEMQLPASKLFEESLQVKAIERMERQKQHIADSKVNKAHVANNSGEYEWYTPALFIEAARRAMGSIDTDPATSETANATVRATTIYTLKNSGLDYANKWRGNVWLNPPYADSLVGDFTRRLVDQFNDNETRQAIVLVNNATETQWFQELLGHASAVCFPSSRIKFGRPGGETGHPLQGQAILYLGENVADFAREFKAFGKVLYAGWARCY